MKLVRRRKSQEEKQCVLLLRLKTKDCLCQLFGQSPWAGSCIRSCPFTNLTLIAQGLRSSLCLSLAVNFWVMCPLQTHLFKKRYLSPITITSSAPLCKLSNMIWMWALLVHPLKRKLLGRKVVEKRKISEKTQQNCPMWRLQISQLITKN